jgi:type IV pilus assembly protein PilB
MARVRIGELLVQHGSMDSAQLASAVAHQRRWGGRIGRSILQLGFVNEMTLLATLGEQLGVPFVHIGDRVVPPSVLALVPAKLAIARRVLPLERRKDHRRGPLVVALSDPADLGVLDELRFVSGLEVQGALASDADLDRAIARHFGGASLPVPGGFAGRTDAIDLPDDTSPLSRGPGRRGGNGTPEA